MYEPKVPKTNLSKEEAEYIDARSTLFTRMDEYIAAVVVVYRPDEVDDPEGAKSWDEVEELYGAPLRIAALTYFDRAKNEFKRRNRVMAEQLGALLLNGGDVDGWIKSLNREEKVRALLICNVLSPMIDDMIAIAGEAIVVSSQYIGVARPF